MDYNGFNFQLKSFHDWVITVSDLSMATWRSVLWKLFFSPPNQRFLDPKLSLQPVASSYQGANRLEDGSILGAYMVLHSPFLPWFFLSLSFSLSSPQTHSRTYRHNPMNQISVSLINSRALRWTTTCVWVAHRLKSSSSAFGFRILKSHSWCKWQAFTQSDFVSHSLFSPHIHLREQASVCRHRSVCRHWTKSATWWTEAKRLLAVTSLILITLTETEGLKMGKFYVIFNVRQSWSNSQTETY